MCGLPPTVVVATRSGNTYGIIKDRIRRFTFQADLGGRRRRNFFVECGGRTARLTFILYVSSTHILGDDFRGGAPPIGHIARGGFRAPRPPAPDRWDGANSGAGGTAPTR